jgi:hypothetical protein
VTLGNAGHLKELTRRTLTLGKASNSAHVAAIFRQRPLQLAVKASKIIPQIT